MIILDTHTFLWYVAEPEQLGHQAVELIEEAALTRQLFVSAVTFWEIALLQAKRKVLIPISVAQIRSRSLSGGLQETTIDGEVAALAVNLRGLPSNLADRLIVATALQGYKLITADPALLAWEGRLPRFDSRS